MRKFLKILSSSLLLLVAGTLLAAFLVDPNDFKDQVEARVSAEIGREAHINGKLRFLLLPRPGLVIRDMVFGSALGADGPPLAEVDLVRLVPRIWSLLQGRTELDLVRLVGLRVHLSRDTQGRGSWEPIEVPPGPETGAQVPFTLLSIAQARPQGFLEVSAAETPPVRPVPVVDRLELADARVIWDDRQAGLWLALDAVEASAQPAALGESAAFRITAVARVAEGGAPIGLRGAGNLLVDSALRRLRLDAFRLELDGLGTGGGVDASVLLQTDLDADLAVRRYLADGMTLELHASGSALAGGSIDAKAAARIELDLDTEILKVSDLSLRSGTLSARGTAFGQSLLSAPVFTGELALDAFDLRAWLEQRGLPLPWTVDPQTFHKVSLAACWRLEQGQIGLQELLLGIDETSISGEIERIANGSPLYRFDLLANVLDLDRYLSPREAAQAGSDRTSQHLAPPDRPVPLKAALDHEADPGFVFRVGTPAATPPLAGAKRFPVFPRSLDDLGLDGRLRIGELKLARLRFGDADFRIRAKDGLLDLEDEVQSFYRGQLTGNLGLDLRGPETKVTLVQRAAAIDAGPLLADLTGTDSLTGRGEITADLAATGRRAVALRSSLAGDLAIHVTDGAVKGFGLERMIAEARARFTGKPPPAGMPTQTDFKDLRASAEIQAGVLSNRDLVATADKLRVTGKGTLDLVRERFDYRFAPMLVQTPEGGGIKELEGIPVPVHLTGSFARPRWDVDVASALSAVAKRELRGQGSGLFKKLEERTGIKGLEQGLRGLFGR